MSRTLIFLLVAMLVISPVLLAVEPVDEYPARWGCSVTGGPNGERICSPDCIEYDATRYYGDIRWNCPGSGIRTECTNQPCRTEESCRRYGIPYVPCHDRENWVCSAKAKRETRATCPHNGPPGSAVKFGDCVLRVVKDVARGKASLRRDCFDVRHDAYALESWSPQHPAELFEWFYTDGNTDPAYPAPVFPPIGDPCDRPNPDSRFECP